MTGALSISEVCLIYEQPDLQFFPLSGFFGMVVDEKFKIGLFLQPEKKKYTILIRKFVFAASFFLDT